MVPANDAPLLLAARVGHVGELLAEVHKPRRAGKLIREAAKGGEGKGQEDARLFLTSCYSVVMLRMIAAACIMNCRISAQAYQQTISAFCTATRLPNHGFSER